MDIKTAKNYFDDFHKDGDADKFIDLFPTDKYRTDNTSIKLFNFDYHSFPTNESSISYFDKHFKDVKGNDLPREERVPLTHYKQTHMNPVPTEDVFGNNIINHQKDIKVTKKELPEKYEYGLDHKGLGDIAYERLDIEQGDSNELSRALENFYENHYLQKELPKHPKLVSEREREQSFVDTLDEAYDAPASSKTMQKKKDQVIEKAKGNLARQRKNIQKIEVEAIPELLGKTPQEYDPEDVYNKYLPLQQQPDRVLAQKELYEINNMLISHGHKPLPVGTRSKAAARKLNKLDISHMSLQEKWMADRADQKEIIKEMAKGLKKKAVEKAANEYREGKRCQIIY